MSRSALMKRLGAPAAIAAAALLGLTAEASAQMACGVPPSGLVRLWAGIGCQGQTMDFTTSSIVNGFPAYSISNGTGQWIALSNSVDPTRATHTLLIENGCYYADLSEFHWQNGQSWVGNIRSIQVLPPGANPYSYPTTGDRVIGKCM